MNFIWIGSHAPENQTHLFLLFESEFFGENMVLRPTSSSAVTTATIHLPIQIWLFLFIPQITYFHTKNEEGLKIFISNFASLSWRIALNKLTLEVLYLLVENLVTHYEKLDIPGRFNSNWVKMSWALFSLAINLFTYKAK